MGTINEYVSHCVCLWKGAIVSHGCAGGAVGSVVQGHASPRGKPLIWVLEMDHIDAKPSVSTDHSVVIGTTGTEFIWVAG